MWQVEKWKKNKDITWVLENKWVSKNHYHVNYVNNRQWGNIDESILNSTVTQDESSYV